MWGLPSYDCDSPWPLRYLGNVLLPDGYPGLVLSTVSILVMLGCHGPSSAKCCNLRVMIKCESAKVATYKMRNFENAKVAAKVMCTMRKSNNDKVVSINIFLNMHIRGEVRSWGWKTSTGKVRCRTKRRTYHALINL